MWCCSVITELVHTSKKDDQRDFLFYLAVANYRLKVSYYFCICCAYFRDFHF